MFSFVAHHYVVMAGLVTASPVYRTCGDKRGHDEKNDRDLQ
jgi:hypothetical protein